MQTEIEKRIEEAAYSYDIPRHFNCYGCCQSDSDYEKAFKAGAKFILEMPELRDAIEVLWTCEVSSEGRTLMRVKNAIEALKKAGLCE